jgi:hypothetical protein
VPSYFYLIAALGGIENALKWRNRQSSIGVFRSFSIYSFRDSVVSTGVKSSGKYGSLKAEM